MIEATVPRSLTEIRDELHESLDAWLRENATVEFAGALKIRFSSDIADVGIVCAAIRDLDHVIQAQTARAPAPPVFDVAALHSVAWNAASDAGATAASADRISIRVVEAMRGPFVSAS